jgi:hypothetical protein
MTQEALEGLAATCNPDTGCEGSWNIAELKDGTRALLITKAPDVDSIVWLGDGKMFTVSGPSDAFSPESARAVADIFQRASS